MQTEPPMGRRPGGRSHGLVGQPPSSEAMLAMGDADGASDGEGAVAAEVAAAGEWAISPDPDPRWCKKCKDQGVFVTGFQTAIQITQNTPYPR